MLTADQIRLRLDRLVEQEDSACNGCFALIGVLHDVLPQLVAPAIQPERTESQFRDYHAAVCRRCGTEIRATTREGLYDGSHVCIDQYSHARLCLDCTPDAPCDRARELIGG